MTGLFIVLVLRVRKNNQINKQKFDVPEVLTFIEFCLCCRHATKQLNHH